MVKKGRNETTLLSEHWDSDASASDNESFNIEMLQDESIKVPDTKTEIQQKITTEFLRRNLTPF